MRAAAMYTLLESGKMNGLDPEAYLRDVLAGIADQSHRRTLALELEADRLTAHIRHHENGERGWPVGRTLTEILRNAASSCAKEIVSSMKAPGNN